MFDASLLNNFYIYEDSVNQESGASFDVSNEVKTAYYKFIKDFCPMVSAHWKKYLYKECAHRETATYLNQLTRSDEAFSFWLIQCLVPKVAADHKFITENGIKKWTEERKRGKGGKHDSNVKFDEFLKIFNTIDMVRNNEKAYAFWMNIFFDQFFKEFKKRKLPVADKEDEIVDREQVSIKTIEIQQLFD